MLKCFKQLVAVMFPAIKIAPTFSTLTSMESLIETSMLLYNWIINIISSIASKVMHTQLLNLIRSYFSVLLISKKKACLKHSVIQIPCEVIIAEKNIFYFCLAQSSNQDFVSKHIWSLDAFHKKPALSAPSITFNNSLIASAMSGFKCFTR